MSQAVDDLVAKVAAEDTVIGSAIVMLNGIKAQIDAAVAAALAGDNSKLTALSADVASNTTALANAVVANTPPAPAAFAAKRK